MLYGRSAETARIDDLLDAARTGRSAALLLRGGPGVGKSALLDYAAKRATGLRVLRCTGIESESELAFAALHLLLRPGLGDLDALAEPQAAALRGAFGLAATTGDDRFLIGLAALSLLAELAGDRPLLCLVDDAQWLDRASADALLFASRRLDAEGVVVLFGARDEGPAAPGVEELKLTGLDREASGLLLDEHTPGLRPHERERVLAESDGNPLALLELPGAAAGAAELGSLPLPQRIQDAYHRQVIRLARPTRTFLLVAAAEETGDLAATLRAAELLGGTAAAADEAERHGLITMRDLTVVFRHPLVRAAVYQGATFAERRAAHQALAGVLSGEQDSDRRAWHLAAAASGPDEAIAAELERTALRARERLGYAAAAAALERAAMLTPDRPERAGRLVAAAESAFDAGLPAAAGTLAGQAIRFAGDPRALARIASLRAQVAAGRGSTRAAHEILIAASGPIEELDPDTNVLMLVEAVRAAWFIGEPALMKVAADRLRAAPPPQDALVPLIHAGLALDDLTTGQVGRALPPIAALVAFGRGLPDGLVGTRTNAAGIALLNGDFEAAREIGLAVVRECRTDGMIGRLPVIQLALTLAETFLNRFRDAEATAAEGLRLAVDTDQPNHAAHLRAVLAWLAAFEGDEHRCRTLAEQSLQYFSIDGVINGATVAHWALATLDLGLGRLEAALDRLETTALGPARHQMDVTYFAPDQIEAAVRLGRPDRATQPMARFTVWADAVQYPWAQALLHRCRALTGPDHEAEDDYAAALRLHTDRERPFEHARTELLYGEWLRRGRRQSDARGHLRNALTLFERTGAKPWADRARAELRAAGERVTATGGDLHLLDLLTPQERQVVRLAATGATNRDIAAQLFLSPRTISHHLYRAFPKLGVTTRIELAHLHFGD
ncbi:AAA family ATPase [Streptosporangium sp. CA-135522]|uniref:helix-turn-helix transcriptional regulator n=1 Tax=Streptosporangium sp. CA-135522 TaxID=3240072 RepID=UPI003D8D2566